MVTSVSDKLSALVAEGTLRPDAAQMAAARELDGVLRRLADRKTPIFGDPEPVRGLYLWGGVGRGKSMIMDWFFEAAPVEPKRRVHFHAFMIDVHARIHAARQAGESAGLLDRLRGRDGDPIAVVAEDVAESAKLLCFDEFHVTDITDAMILSRLFEALLARGATVVATSNREPDDLYRNGLNRGLFLPFIEMLKDRLVVHEIADGADHRLRALTRAPIYYSPLDAETEAAMDAAWTRLIGQAEVRPTCLSVQGRALQLRRTAAGVARASFDRLCGTALGAADYLRLAQSFQTLMLDRVPQMDRSMRNEAKRFVTLIDALYETRTKLVMSAAVEPDALYVDGDGSFEFARTASRLMEMRSEDYLAQRRIMGEAEAA